MSVSVIIPTYNEGTVLANTMQCLQQPPKNNFLHEIIVVDGGSSDNTMAVAVKYGAVVISATKGRASQMNAGAAIATGDILYFLHADTIPPVNFLQHINEAINKGYGIGCFRLRFNHDHWFLRANAWFTRFNVNVVRFGDQSLFVQKEVFIKTGGFNNYNIILEDQEIITRLQHHGRLYVMPAYVTTSARKYITNGVYKTQGVYFVIYSLYRLGINQQRLLMLYKRWIRQDKL